jgi:hypothetical protein
VCRSRPVHDDDAVFRHLPSFLFSAYFFERFFSRFKFMARETIQFNLRKKNFYWAWDSGNICRAISYVRMGMFDKIFVGTAQNGPPLDTLLYAHPMVPDMLHANYPLRANDMELGGRRPGRRCLLRKGNYLTALACRVPLVVAPTQTVF